MNGKTWLRCGEKMVSSNKMIWHFARIGENWRIENVQHDKSKYIVPAICGVQFDDMWFADDDDFVPLFLLNNQINNNN